jgi:hypothetical protein
MNKCFPGAGAFGHVLVGMCHTGMGDDNQRRWKMALLSLSVRTEQGTALSLFISVFN